MSRVNNFNMKNREASLEEDLFLPNLEFSDHVVEKENRTVLKNILFGDDKQNADYQRFIRIASAQEMEDFDSFYDTNEGDGEFSLSSPDSGVHEMSQMDPDRAKYIEEKKKELARCEEEINTLRMVLSGRIKLMQELKRELGITVWKEFKDDMELGIKNVQESTAFQKTSQTLKTATDKTSEALGAFGATVSKKLEEVKQSSAFKSIEEKVGSVYTSVKTKISGSNVEGSGNDGQPVVEK